jgi:hypothetical protein
MNFFFPAPSIFLKRPRGVSLYYLFIYLFCSLRCKRIVVVEQNGKIIVDGTCIVNKFRFILNNFIFFFGFLGFSITISIIFFSITIILFYYVTFCVIMRIEKKIIMSIQTSIIHIITLFKE